MRLFVFVLAFTLIARGFAFQCDDAYSRECASLAVESAKEALEDAVNDADIAVISAVDEVLSEVAGVYQKFLPAFANAGVSEFQIDDQIIKIDTTDLSFSKANEILQKLQELLAKVGKSASDLVQKSLAKIRELAQQILEKLNKKTDEATYGIDIADLKDKLKKALSGFGPIVKMIVSKAIDYVKGEIDQLSDRISKIMHLIGMGDKWDKIKAIIDGVIEKVKEKAVGDAMTKAGHAFAIAAQETDDALLYIQVDAVDQALLTMKPLNGFITYGLLNPLESYIRRKLEEALKPYPKIVQIVVLKVFDFAGGKILDFLPQLKFALKILNLATKYYPKIKAVIEDVISKVKSVGDELTLTQNDVEYGWSDLWGKVKEAAKNLGTKVKAAIEKFKPVVIDGLNRVKEVVITEGKKILITIRDGVVRIISGVEFVESSPSVHYGIKDWWGSVKDAASKLGDKIKASVTDIINKNKPLIEEHLKKMKEILIDAGKKILIRIVNDVVTIIVGDDAGYSSEVMVYKRGFADLWTKVKEAAKNMGDNVKAAIEKFKPKIIDGLNNVKAVVIDAGKKIVITIKDELVRIISGAEVAESDSDVAFGFGDWWEKVKSAAKKLGTNIKAKAKEIIEKNKPFIKDQLNKMKDVFIDAGKKILIKMVGSVVEVIVGDEAGSSSDGAVYKRGFADLWTKVKAAAKNLGTRVNEAIEKFKPKVIDGLNKVKEVVITEGKKIFITIRDGIVRIISGADIVENNAVVQYGIKDWWAKVKDTAGKLKDKIKASVIKIIDANKPLIMEQLKKMKEILIDAGKKILIRIVNDVVTIIVGEDAGYSSEVMVYKRGLSDLWTKVKAAAEKLGDNVKAAIEKFKPKVIDGLNTVKQVVIDAGKKIVITIRNEVVRIISGVEEGESDMDTAFGFRDWWEKVKEATKKLGEKVKTSVKKIIDDNKPLIVEQLKKMKEIFIDGAKKILIQVVGNVVKVMVGEDTGYSAEPMVYKRGLVDIWKKVKDAIKKLSSEVKDFIKASSEKVRVKILAAIETAKAGVDGFIKVTIEKGKQIWVKMQDGKVKIVADVKNVWEKVESAASKLSNSTRAKVESLIKKYKPVIIEGLNKVGEVVIERGKKIIISIKNNIVEIITGADLGESSDLAETYGWNDVWEKVKEAAGKFTGKVKTIVINVINENKPKIIAELNKMKQVLIDAGKKFLIKQVGKIVQIIISGEIVYSEPEHALLEKRGLSDLWDKVKSAASNLHGKTKAKVEAIIAKYKQKIIEGLNNVKTVIIEEGKRIVITIQNEVVKIITNAYVAEEDVSTYGMTDLWDKVKSTASKLTSKWKEIVIKEIEAMKPKILEHLKAMKKIVIDGTKKIMIEIVNESVKIIIGDSIASSDDNAVAVYHVQLDAEYAIWDFFTKFWEKIKNMKESVKKFVEANWDKVKPKLEEALEKAKADIGNFKEVVVDGVEKLWVKVDALGTKVIADVKQVWAKVEASVEKVNANVKDYVKNAVEKYKPQIIEKLNEFKEKAEKYKDFVIEGAKKIYIRITAAGVKIVTDGKDVWEKVKAAVSKLSKETRDQIAGSIEMWKPVIIEKLNNAKHVVVNGAKKIYLELKGKIVKIIHGNEIVNSDVPEHEVLLLEKRGIKEWWGKVKAAFNRVGAKIKAFFKGNWDKLKPKILAALEKAKADLNGFKEVIVEGAKKLWVKVQGVKVKIIADVNNVWEKVKAAAEKLSNNTRAMVKAAIEKYKPIIIDELNKVKEVVINGAKKIIINIRDEIVKIISGVSSTSESSEVGFGLRDIWTKVKDAAARLGGNIKAGITKIIDENKPKIVDALKNMKEIVINAGKTILIEVKGAIVKIIVGEEASSSDFAIDKRGIVDIWNKVKAAVTKAGQNLKDFFKGKWDVVEPKIQAAIEKAKKDFGEFKGVVVDGVEKLWVKVDAMGVKVITDAKNVWKKVQEKVNSLVNDRLKPYVKAKIEEYKPKIIEALNDFKENVEKFKDFVIEGAEKIYVRITAKGVQIVTDAAEVWEKVEAAIENLSRKTKDFVKAKVEEWKPVIIEKLNAGKGFIIEGATKIYLKIKNAIVRIITGAEISSSDVNQYGLTDLWTKVKSAASKLGLDKLVEDLKPKILDSLNKIKEITINAGKKILIEVAGELVRIITGTDSATSENNLVYKEKRGIADFWNKVKSAFSKLGDKIKNFVRGNWEKLKPKIQAALKKAKEDLNGFKEIIVDGANKLWVKIKDGKVKVIADTKNVWIKVKAAAEKLSAEAKAFVKAAIEKYKPIIIDELTRLKETAIDAGKKIFIKLKEGIVTIISGVSSSSNSEVAQYGLTDIWGKVKDAASRLGDKVKASVKKVIEENKPKVIDALKKIGEIIIDAGKKILIEIVDNTVKIIIGEDAASSGYQLSKRGLSDIWNKVKESVKKAGTAVTDFFKKNYDKLKPKIEAAVAKAAQDMGEFKEVVVEGATKIWVKVTETGVKIVTDVNSKFQKALEKAQSLIEDVLKPYVEKKIAEWKPKLVEAMNDLKDKAGEYKDFIIEGSKKIFVRVTEAGAKIIVDGKDVLSKLEVAVEKLQGKVKDNVKAAIEKYKPLIVEKLNEAKEGAEVIIEHGEKILIKIKNGVVHIITKVKSADELTEASFDAVEKRGLSDIWGKVKDALKKIGSKISESTKKIIDAAKPKIIDSLNKIKEIVIEAGKKILINAKGEIIKIIIGV